METRAVRERGIGRAFRRARLVAALLCVACGDSERTLDSWTLPDAVEWWSVGTVLERGPEGAWDRELGGSSVPGSIVRKDGMTYLYYTGADGIRRDGGPRHRAVGLATSSDGIRFTKHRASPLVTHLPTHGEEEGANSAAVALDEDGRFVMFYGAATEIDAENIFANMRVATSEDGVAFQDSGGIVLDHRDRSVYGWGDELFPLAAYQRDGRWYVFYLSNGGTAPRDIAVASGPAIDRLTDTRRVLDGAPENPARVGGNAIPVDGDEVLLLVQRGWHPNIRMTAHLAPAVAPHELGPPIARWEGGPWSAETKFSTLFLDERTRTWFLYRSRFDRVIELHLAPAAEPDRTAPSQPGDLRLEGGSERPGLRWSAASDPETGVAGYRVYRDGMRVAFTIETRHHDPRLLEAGPWSVAAVNLHGTEGEPAVLATAR